MQDSCCKINIDGREVEVKIKHRGRGRFEIVDGENKGEIIDASDVVDCKCS